MKKLFTILSFSLFSVTLNADYSGFLFNGGTANDYGYDIKQTADGGVIIVGTTSSYGAGGKDVYIIKKDIHNDTTWTKTFGGTGDEEGYSVVQTPDGKYAITGYTTSYGRGEEDLLFLKLNSNGSLDYYQTYGGTASEIGRKIILMPDSGFTMVGYTKSYGAGGKDIYIVQLDKSGNTIWSDYYGTTANDEAYSMLQNDDGNLIIAACTEYNAASYKSIYLLNIKPTGSSNWAKIISSSLNETPLAIAETYDRNYLITGKSVAPSSSNDNILLAKFDTLGNLIFKNNYGGKRSDIGNAIIPYFDMGYYVVGTSRSYNNDSIPEIYLMQVDEWGDSIQATTFSHDYEDYASAAILTTDSNIIIVGSSGNGDRAIDIAQLPTSLNCVGYYPRSILVGPLWAPANDSLLNPGTPIEPFPAIMHSEYQKLRFANYLLHGHFHEIIIAVDSLFEEDEGSGNDHNSAVNGVVLRDSLSALILRLKTYYKVTKVIAWIQHTRDEKTAMDTTNNMDIVRRLVKFNTDTAHHGKFDGMYDDYEFWEKRYGWSNGNTTDPDFGNIDTGYVRFKQLLNAMLTVRTNPSNKLPFLYIYLADLYRSGDSLHPNVLDYKVLNYVDSIANYANTNLFGSYAVKTPYVNISLQFYITDLTDSGNCGQGKWPTRFIVSIRPIHLVKSIHSDLVCIKNSKCKRTDNTAQKQNVRHI